MASLLREAAGLLHRRAAEAPEFADERWMVGQDETDGLVLTAFTPQYVATDGTVSSGILASFAYPDNPVRHTHARALRTVPRTRVHRAGHRGRARFPGPE
ncbi:hypothetical protein ABZX62_26475 [Streptomyces flavidovirens]|uniref:hypothetical protein n=1 Tax=Streptomyces flavidovirens TaxID=67298 RepID=UPI0033AA0E03